MKIEIVDVKPYLDSLNEKEKDKLIARLLAKNRAELDAIYFQKVASKDDLEDLFADVKAEIEGAMNVYINYGTLQKNLAKGIQKATQAINRYKAIDRRPEKEGELIMHMLEIIFTEFGNEFGTCWTVFDFRVAQAVSKVVTIVTKKIHADYRMDFEDKINGYIQRLKAVASHNDVIYNLPDKICY
ncbi:MAG: hypothetical protein RIB71_13310 [Imperialibacter sp.]|uniref:hypothetical protein n=1 Tax=Imperialibacter sp. TaxID=2038411 RepID=UPI0032EFA345